MTTPRDLIGGAHRLLGLVQSGDALPEAVYQDHLASMNQMLSSWSTERLSVYATQDQVFTWPASTITRSIGPTGDFIGNRPIALDDSTYFVDAGTGVSYGIKIINQQQYDGIAVKTVTSTYPQVIWLNMDVPNMSMSAYPVATRALEWHFISVDELAQPALLTTDLAFPPGYERAFRYNLAMEIGAEFGKKVPFDVSRLAMTSKRSLKSQNSPGDIMALPYSIVGGRQRYNIYAGNY